MAEVMMTGYSKATKDDGPQMACHYFSHWVETSETITVMWGCKNSLESKNDN